jgi:hypothetical protein
MPVAPEVDVFDGKVGSDEQILVGRQTQDGRVISDARQQSKASGPAGRSRDGLPTDSLDQRLLALRHGITITPASI